MRNGSRENTEPLIAPDTYNGRDFARPEISSPRFPPPCLEHPAFRLFTAAATRREKI